MPRKVPVVSESATAVSTSSASPITTSGKGTKSTGTSKSQAPTSEGADSRPQQKRRKGSLRKRTVFL